MTGVAVALPLSYPDKSGVGIEPTTYGSLVQKRFRQSAYRTSTELILRGHTETLARYYVEPFKPLPCKKHNFVAPAPLKGELRWKRYIYFGDDLILKFFFLMWSNICFS